MAVHETEIPFVDLPSNVNYYLHFAGPHSRFDSQRPLALIHYHNSSLNFLGLLETIAAVAPYELAAVSQANQQIGQHFESEIFWNMRYRHFPERGSGIGSRGDNLIYKRDLLKAEGAEKATSVLDIGCGDLEVVSVLGIRNYVGVDQSVQSLAVASAKRPDWQFLLAPTDQAMMSDFVICLEVVIHQTSYDEYKGIIGFAAEMTQRRLIISGYDQEGDHVLSNHMIYFYEPLRNTLENTKRFASITKIGSHSDVVIYRCDVVDTAKK